MGKPFRSNRKVPEIIGKRWIFPLLSVLLLTGFTRYVYAQPGIFPYTEKGLIGYRTADGKVLVPPVYDYAEEFNPGFSWTVVGIGEWKLLNNSISEREVQFTGKMGMIDKAGREIISPMYDLVLEFYRDYAVVGKGIASLVYRNFPDDKGFDFKGDIGVVNKSGKQIVPVSYQSIERIRRNESSYWFAHNPVPGTADIFIDGEKVSLPDSTSEIRDFREGLAAIEAGSKWGYLDTAGHLGIPLKYDKAADFSNGTALVREGGKYYFIDLDGIKKSDRITEFDEAGSYREGYARVRLFDKYGFIDKDSCFFKIPRFGQASTFFDDIAWVTTVDSFGYVFTDGREDLVRRYEFEIEPPWSPVDFPPDGMPAYIGLPVKKEDSAYLFQRIDSLDLRNMLTVNLNAMRWAPYLYFRYPQMLPKVCAGEGTLAGRFLFGTGWLDPAGDSWRTFRKEALFRIIGEEKWRKMLWKWMKPYCRTAFRSMPELHRRVYRNMMVYLDSYYRNYNMDSTRNFLDDHWDDFAYFNPDGSLSPFRKVSALIDRLILVHNLITPGEVRDWMSRIRRELDKW